MHRESSEVKKEAKLATVLEPAPCELVLTRVFDASRELVFKAWTELEWLMRWWRPKGFTMPLLSPLPLLWVSHCLWAHDGVKLFSCQEAQLHAGFAQASAVCVCRVGNLGGLVVANLRT
jgi:hypothetical protein